MSLIKTAEDVELLRVGGRRLAQVLNELAARVKPGITGLELDKLARELIAAQGDQPSFLNYRAEGTPAPFPAALCVSINEEIVHGLPDARLLKAGDIVSLDLGLNHGGRFTDMAVTVLCGSLTSTGSLTSDAVSESQRLIETTREALVAGIKRARAGNTVGDIGFAVNEVARAQGYGVVRELGGHGVGHKVHEPPHIPNFGKRGTGAKLKPGMVIAIEPMFTLGGPEVIFHRNGYLATTADGSRAAHFEHTVLITAGEAEILTQ